MNKLYNQLNENFQNQIDSVISHIQTLNLEKEILHQFYEYTLHDLNHFNQVAENAGKIVEGENLSQEEIFCLLACCYSHDLGMAHTDAQQKFNITEVDEIRKLHATLSRIYIFDNLRSCIPDEEYREAVGKISEGHGRWDWESPYFNSISGKSGDIRVRYLLCVLSLADLLDIRNNRKNPNSFQSVEHLLNGSISSRISIIHWLKHYYSKLPDIRNNGGTIEITLKADVGTMGLGTNQLHKRVPLIQELIQGEILKVINHDTFRKVASRFFKVKLIPSASKWPCFVHLTESHKMEFPEDLVEDVLKLGFLYPKSLELKTYDEYKSYSPNSFFSKSDLQISYSERPASIIPTWIAKMKDDINKGTHDDNWDIVLWCTDFYVRDIEDKFHTKTLEDIVSRTYSILEAAELIKSGIFKKVYIEASELSLSTATATRYAAKQAYKFGGSDFEQRSLSGGKIELLSSYQRELYGRYWNNVSQKLGLKINSDQFRDYVTSDFAYNCSIIPIFKVASELHKFRIEEKNAETKKELDQRLSLLKPLVELNTSLLNVIKGNSVTICDLEEKDIADLKVFEKTSFKYPWAFKTKTQKSLFDKNSKNLIIRSSTNIVGYLFSKIIDDDICYIRKMTIHPFFRRRGLARKLMNTIFEKEKVTNGFALHVRKSNRSAISLYKEMGFKILDEIENHFKKTGITKDDKTALYMVKSTKV